MLQQSLFLEVRLVSQRAGIGAGVSVVVGAVASADAGSREGAAFDFALDNLRRYFHCLILTGFHQAL